MGLVVLDRSKMPHNRGGGGNYTDKNEIAARLRSIFEQLGDQRYLYRSASLLGLAQRNTPGVIPLLSKAQVTNLDNIHPFFTQQLAQHTAYTGTDAVMLPADHSDYGQELLGVISCLKNNVEVQTCEFSTIVESHEAGHIVASWGTTPYERRWLSELFADYYGTKSATLKERGYYIAARATASCLAQALPSYFTAPALEALHNGITVPSYDDTVRDIHSIHAMVYCHSAPDILGRSYRRLAHWVSLHTGQDPADAITSGLPSRKLRELPIDITFHTLRGLIDNHHVLRSSAQVIAEQMWDGFATLAPRRAAGIAREHKKPFVDLGR